MLDFSDNQLLDYLLLNVLPLDGDIRLFQDLGQDDFSLPEKPSSEPLSERHYTQTSSHHFPQNGTSSITLAERYALSSPEMMRLRELMLEPERQRITELEAEIGILRQKLNNSEALIEILSPIIGYAIAERVRESRDEVAEALYPVIGKTITRAVSESLRDLAQRIDASMRRGLSSPKRLIHRWGMMLRGVDPQSGTFRDLLPFQVQEIFLIHRDSGLLLQHLSSTNTLTDADLISGMLTAIRSYVKDSFGSSKDGSLDAITYGDLRILIEEGSVAYLAIVLEGIEPSGFQSRMREQLSELHNAHNTLFRSYQGDPIDDELIIPFLQPLMEEYHATT